MQIQRESMCTFWLLNVGTHTTCMIKPVRIQTRDCRRAAPKSWNAGHYYADLEETDESRIHEKALDYPNTVR